MPAGPITLFDKSFLQSLSLDEAVLFDHFFMSVICPLFYVETLADLEKKVQGRSSEAEVRIIAQKAPEMSGRPCAHHQQLIIGNLLGHSIPMTGQVPIAGGRPVRVDGKKGIVFERSDEAEAFERWQNEEFHSIERDMAKGWRQQVASLDLLALAAGMKAMGIDNRACKTLADAKALATRFVNDATLPAEKLKLAFIAGDLPTSLEAQAARLWESIGFPPLAKFAPYAAHALTVELFFQIALGADLISPNRASNRVDVCYLLYAPFCMIFVSSDKLHRRTAPLFLREDQIFVWGEDLKKDLGRLVEKFKGLPQETLELGLMKFAPQPPSAKEGFLVRKLWDEAFSRHAKSQLVEEAMSGADGDGDAKKLVRGDDLGAYLNRFAEAETLNSEDIDFNMTEPQVTSIKHKVHRRRGSFYQVPKNLKVD